MKPKVQDGVRWPLARSARPGGAAAVLLVAALLGAGDTPPATARVTAGLAATAAAPAAGLPRFARFGWVSPPRESTSVARYAELAGAGFNVTVLAWADSGFRADNLARLACTRDLGVRNLLFDRRLERTLVDTLGANAIVDSCIADYAGDPAFLGWYLGDEPTGGAMNILSGLAARLRARDPEHPVWNNLSGRSAFTSVAAYRASIEHYVSAIHPSVLCADHYEFLESGDRHQLAENIATLASVARAHGLPFWGIVLLTRHSVYRDVSDGMLRWQVGQWLAWGAHGIGYFTYWTPAPDPEANWQPAMIEWGTGRRTERYDLVRALDARLAVLGDTLAGLQWLGTSYAGSVPPGGTRFASGAPLVAVAGRATIGQFADANGAPCALVVNADSLAPATLLLTLDPGRSASRLQDGDGRWQALPVDALGRLRLPLDAGDFALLRFSGGTDSLVAGHAPVLRVRPNPASTRVLFERAPRVADATLEVLDAGGRRVWAHVFASGDGAVEWRGDRDGGGAVPPGVLFARIEDAQGVSVHRFSWLGRP